MNRRGLAVLAFLATLCIPCAAQELDIFELNDFVDPRLRGVEMEDLKVTSPGTNYQFFRAIFGGIANYTTRTKPTHADVGFVHLAGSLYSGMNQFNVRVTTLQEQGTGSRPLVRITGQFARYSFSSLEDSRDHNKKEIIADRYLLTSSVEERDICESTPVNVKPSQTPRQPTEHVTFGGGAGTTCKRHIDSELAVQADSALGPIGSSDLMMYSLGLRNTFEDGFVYRGTIGMRLLQLGSTQNGFRVAWDHSLENGRGSFHIGATRLAFGYSHRIMKGVTLHGVWQPSYVPRQPGRRVNHEFGVFLDTKLFARIFAPRN